MEVGKASFETPDKHFTILDAPGHRGFVPNMIAGAAQADIAVLVISARRGEFETGFEKAGQTREHAMLVKTLGTKHLIVLINKMDDPTVAWSEERYLECKTKLEPYLCKQLQFNLQRDIYFMPCSGLTGAFLRDIVPDTVCPWYRGPSLFEYLNDHLPSIQRNVDGAVRLPVAERFQDMGTIIGGKLESGIISKNSQLLVMPNRVTVQVLLLLQPPPPPPPLILLLLRISSLITAVS